MEERKLEVLKFNISTKEDRKTKVNMSSIDGVDLLDTFFKHFIQFIESLEPNERTKRVVKLGDSFNKPKGIRTVSGILETGKYGKEEKVVDVTKKDIEAVFKIHKNHSVQKPFFFLVCIPRIKDEGLIILEREGQFGIKSLFTFLFHTFVEANFPLHIVQYSNFVDDEVVKNFIQNGAYNSISLTRTSLPQDIADRYGLEMFENNDYVIELSIKAKGKKHITGDSRKRIREVFESNPDGFFSSESFTQLGFDENAVVKVNATYRNSKRTIDLSQTMRFRPYYDINVDLNETGHSSFDSIEQEAVKLMKDFNLDLF